MEITTYQSYQQYKAAVDTELQRATESFVRIGYLLKVARDTDILKESGYETVNDFAKAEYGIDRTQVSRFMNINDRFSEGGYSDRLQTTYQGMGYTKLSIMLTLPDSINEQITSDYSKSEIQDIKDEVDAERERTDIEIILEGQNPVQAVMDNNLSKALHQLMHDQPKLYMEWCKVNDAGKSLGCIPSKVDVMEVLAPSETASYSIRIQGVGRLMLFIKGETEPLTLVNIKEDTTETYPWDGVVEYMLSLAEPYHDGVTREDAWEQIYGEPFPEEPIPEKAPDPKPEPRKQSKVTKAPEKKKIATVQPKQEESAEYTNEEIHDDTDGQQDDQIPGQESIETLEGGKYMPPVSTEASVDGEKVEAEIEESVENAECEEQSEDDLKRAAGGSIRKINIAMTNRDYNDMQFHAEKLLEIAKILNKEEK